MFVNDQPGTLTLHFDSLRSEAHVQAIPEPGNGFTVFLGLVVASAIARQIRRRRKILIADLATRQSQLLHNLRNPQTCSGRALHSTAS